MLAVVALAVGLATGIAGSATSRRAHAEGSASRAQARVDEGKRLFDNQEYERAIRVLSRVARDRATTRSQRIRALELIGLSHIILGQERRAEKVFWQLLELDPRHELSDDFDSAKIRELFDQVKRDYFPAKLEHRMPGEATGGGSLDVAVRVSVGAEVIKGMRVLIRRQGEDEYRGTRLRPEGPQLWRGQVTAPPSRTPYVLEYYVEGLDLGGRLAGRIGAPGAPLTLPARAGGAVSKSKPWYRRWYTIAGAAALAGFGTALIITAGD